MFLFVVFVIFFCFDTVTAITAYDEKADGNGEPNSG